MPRASQHSPQAPMTNELSKMHVCTMCKAVMVGSGSDGLIYIEEGGWREKASCRTVEMEGGDADGMEEEEG